MRARASAAHRDPRRGDDGAARGQVWARLGQRGAAVPRVPHGRGATEARRSPETVRGGRAVRHRPRQAHDARATWTNGEVAVGRVGRIGRRIWLGGVRGRADVARVVSGVGRVGNPARGGPREGVRHLRRGARGSYDFHLSGRRRVELSRARTGGPGLKARFQRRREDSIGHQAHPHRPGHRPGRRARAARRSRIAAASFRRYRRRRRLAAARELVGSDLRLEWVEANGEWCHPLAAATCALQAHRRGRQRAHRG